MKTFDFASQTSDGICRLLATERRQPTRPSLRCERVTPKTLASARW